MGVMVFIWRLCLPERRRYLQGEAKSENRYDRLAGRLLQHVLLYNLKVFILPELNNKSFHLTDKSIVSLSFFICYLYE